MTATIGFMDRRLSLQKNTPTTGEAGGTKPTWSEVKKIWAQRADKASTEPHEADQQVNVSRVDYIIHFDGQIKAATYRLVDGADIYDIQGIVEEPVQHGQFPRLRFSRLHCLLKDNQ